METRTARSRDHGEDLLVVLGRRDLRHRVVLQDPSAPHDRRGGRGLDEAWRRLGFKFERFDGSDLTRQRLARSLADPGPSRSVLTFDLEPKEWQKPILRELAEARSAGRHKNLVVAATGTGKTLVAAFDFERLSREGAVETLLFVAHRKEILEQARDAFRQVFQLGRGLRRAREKDVLTVFDLTGRQHPRFRVDRHLRGLLGHTPRELRAFVETGFGRLPSGCVVQFEERSQRDILESIKRSIPANVRGMRELLHAHREEGWTLSQFLAETEVDPLDLYRDGRSWSSLRSEVGLLTMPTDDERPANR